MSEEKRINEGLLTAVETEVNYLTILEEQLTPLVANALFATYGQPDKEDLQANVMKRLVQREAEQNQILRLYDETDNRDPRVAAEATKVFSAGLRSHIVETARLASELVPERPELRERLAGVASCAHKCRNLFHFNPNT